MAMNHVGDVVVLLGREAPRRGATRGVGTWCDFGGRVTPKGGCPATCASRELQEETLGLMNIPASGLRHQKGSAARTVLDAGEECFGGSYRMYIIGVPFDPDIPSLFGARRMACLGGCFAKRGGGGGGIENARVVGGVANHVKHTRQGVPHLFTPTPSGLVPNDSMFEKDCLSWVGLHYLLRLLRQSSNLSRRGHILRPEFASTLTRNTATMMCAASKIYNIPPPPHKRFPAMVPK